MIRQSVVAFLVICASAAPAAERVDIVIDKTAPALEQLAARELGDLVRQLFKDVSVTVEDSRPADAKHVVLIGSPETNPLIGKDSGDWPEGDQAIVIRTLDDGTLVIGGGSPIATLWAVYEFGYLNGVRYTLSRDVFPISKRELDLGEHNVIANPVLRNRRFRIFSPALTGLQTMALAEQKQLLTQLSKMKFNGVLIEVAPWHPFVTYEFAGVKKSSADLLAGQEFEINGDTVGRKVFRGLTRFEHPELATEGKSAEARIEAGIEFLRSLTEAAEGLGMPVTLRTSLTANSREFQFVLPESTPGEGLASLAVEPPSDAVEWDKAYSDLLAVRRNALVETYPHAQRIAWTDVARSRAPDLEVVYSVHRVHFPRLSAHVNPLTEERFDNEACPRPGNCRELVLKLSTAGAGVLPQSRLQSLGQRMIELKQAGWRGFTAAADALPEMDVAVHFLSRAGWDEDMTPRQAHDDLWAVTTENEPASARLWIGSGHLDMATALIVDNDPGFATPGPDMLMKHYVAEPAPEWWEAATTHYTQYMIELYRSHGAIDGGAKDLLFYSAKRGEFVLEYLGAVKAVRAAAIAKGEGDNDLAVEKLGEAVETLYNCINTLSDVARDPSDRATIAVLNTFAFQPLLAELERLEQ